MTIYLVRKQDPDLVTRWDNVVSILVDRESGSVYLCVLNTRGRFHETIHDVISFESN